MILTAYSTLLIFPCLHVASDYFACGGLVSYDIKAIDLITTMHTSNSDYKYWLHSEINDYTQ